MSGRSRYLRHEPREPLERQIYGDERDLYRERDLSDAMRTYLAQGGQLLARAIPGAHTVRNVNTGQVLLCCHPPCEYPGDNRIQIAIPHQAPRWFGEKLIYIFCSERCRRAFAAGTPYERFT
jgi:hypothetical protein